MVLTTTLRAKESVRRRSKKVVMLVPSALRLIITRKAWMSGDRWRFPQRSACYVEVKSRATTNKFIVVNSRTQRLVEQLVFERNDDGRWDKSPA